MSKLVTLSGSPSSPSTSDAVLSHVVRRLIRAGHEVQPVVLRELPPEALVRAQVGEPTVAAAAAALEAADGVVLVSPVYKAAYSGLLKIFLDLLPQYAFRGKAVLPLLVGGSTAHVLAVDYALRPVLNSMGAAHIAPGWFVPAGHVTVFPDGGVLLDAATAGPVADATDDFLRHLARPRAPERPSSLKVSPQAGATDLQVRRVAAGDPALQPLLDELVVEYGTRYARVSPYTELTEVPPTDFEPPDGIFLILIEHGTTIAGGALRRYDATTAEVKRVWTSSRHRRRGLGRRLMAELEKVALEMDYARIQLTTGPRQPEARNLYLATGYQPRFDVTADPETIGPLAFGKELVPGAGFAAWPPDRTDGLRGPTTGQAASAASARLVPAPLDALTAVLQLDRVVSRFGG